MKRVITALLLCAISGALIANEKDTVRFVYVLQNPKFYGEDKARSWFEIQGLNDKTVESRINDTLRSAFFELTGLEGGTPNATIRPDGPTPKGFTDYYFWNGQTYGNGWIRFKDSDSLLLLTSADGYYGSGQNLGGFSQEVAEGRLAWIGISTTRFGNGGMETGREINLAFDLRTGTTVPTQFMVRIDPAKRDSLEKTLRSIAEKSVADDNGFHDGKITSADPMSDTVVVHMSQLIRWMRGEKSLYANCICRLYGGTMVLRKELYPVRPQACLSLEESIPFFLAEDWDKLKQL